MVKSDKESTPVAFATVASAHASPALKAFSNHLLLLTMTLDACTTDSAWVNHTVSCFFMASRVRRNTVAPLGVPIPKRVDANRNHGCATVRLSFIFNLILFGLEGMSIDLLKKTPEECDFCGKQCGENGESSGRCPFG